MKFLIENQCIKDANPETIAKFLFDTEGLDPIAIGEYLGEG
jgi:Sec7-like guanine-nucleotide exchange factor